MRRLRATGFPRLPNNRQPITNKERQRRFISFDALAAVRLGSESGGSRLELGP